MLIKNDFEVAEPVEKVWQFFENIPQVATCLPGAELTEDLGGERYKGRVAVRMGPVRLQFAGTADITERDEAAKRVVVERGRRRGEGPRSGQHDHHRDAGPFRARHPGRRHPGLAAVGRRGPVRPGHDLRRQRRCSCAISRPTCRTGSAALTGASPRSRSRRPPRVPRVGSRSACAPPGWLWLASSAVSSPRTSQQARRQSPWFCGG